MIPFTSITFDEAVDFLLDVDNSDYPYIRHKIISFLNKTTQKLNLYLSLI